MPGPLGTWRALRRRGVLGLNARNTAFVLPANPRAFYPRVDDKARTKAMAEVAGIPVPETLDVLRVHRELRDLAQRLPAHRPFVLKPARGAQGNGILVVVARDGDRFQRARGAWMECEEVAQHASSIISGLFSLRGDWDVCLVEAMIPLHPAFRPISRLGIPDVRVVVHLGVPVMAMCRLPTVISDGRANLHQGAIGAGIDLAGGQIVHATHLNRTVIRHVDTGSPVIGFRVPQWPWILELAARAADMTGLRYLGVDVVLDPERGPLLLELNARPGLSIQLANDEGLLPRLERVRQMAGCLPPDPQERCRLAREWFARPLG